MTKSKVLTLPVLFPGAKFQAAAQASVDAILGPLGIHRPVISMGIEFKNQDSWTGIPFMENLSNWLQKHPGKVPSRTDVQKMVTSANQYVNNTPRILLARTPDQLSRRTQLALVGGGYHEAWHTQYSKRDAIQLDEVFGLTQRVGAIVNHSGVFDGNLASLLRSFCAIIEDIRIERRGCEEYPGVKVPMHDLQDFILNLEKKSREGGEFSHRSILLCAFRDLGLGYNTSASREALDTYRKEAPEVVATVAKGGVLHPHLQAAKALAADDKLGYLRVSMECVIALWQASQTDASSEPPPPCCPNCGASAKNLVIRPARDAAGKRIPKFVEVECKLCGFKVEAPQPDTSLELNQNKSEGKDQEKPEMEGFEQQASGGQGEDSEDSDDSDGDSEGDSKKDAKSKDAKGDSSDGEGEGGSSDGDGNEDGKEGSSDGEDGDDSESDSDSDGQGGSDNDEDGDSTKGDGDSEDEDGDSEDGDGEGEEGDSSNSGDSSNGGDGEGDPTKTSQDPVQNGKGAGGHHFAGLDPKTAKGILEDDSGKDPLDSGTALTLAFAAETKKENADLARGEKPWNPFDPNADTARLVRSTKIEADRKQANAMLAQVKPEIATLRARLRSIVRAQEMTDIEHGLRRGKRISDRMLTDSKLSLMGQQQPTRAYLDKEDTLDTSLAMAICLDQSGSMHGILQEVAKAMMVLTEPVEAINGKVFAFGFRDGTWGCLNQGPYHRVHSVHYDVFKHWDERFTNVKWRYAHTQATGGTPMSDGVQYGLTALNPRPEAHRVLAIITDGHPNPGHVEVIRGQLRRAAKTGIHVIGIGIGKEGAYVSSLFPDHVHAASIKLLPRLLIAKLNEVCDFGGRSRGKKIKGLDTRMIKKIS